MRSQDGQHTVHNHIMDNYGSWLDFGNDVQGHVLSKFQSANLISVFRELVSYNAIEALD